ncbi:polysaccharide deacetylase family protein [Massilibacteroides sp.]|uniref:polysaccharide deacetylase family protein n=1 Tax=Massilibacteroides sp. TaxID=2034766 RepID=UPI00261C794D|nr:polysaccharide deacetylase family protein [Massilibacteroides sp.]MDD4516519.1 polysaccharide deacetylase family protein [Massilibacteroides sp.]
MKDYIQYIIRFLLGDSIPGEYISSVGYTDDPRQYDKYSIVIRPCGFFDSTTYGKTSSIPSFPLKQLDRTPLLFGETTEKMIGDTLVLYADLVASSFFLLTRYEEMVKRSVRDEHGRFPGKESFPFRGEFLHRPIVDEYGLYLRNKLRQLGAKLPAEKQSIRKIYLTHDVDAPFYCRTWRSIVREIKNGQSIWKAIKTKTGKLEEDMNYTFPWLFSEDNKLRAAFGKERCKPICFFKGGGNTKQDKPVYSLTNKDIKSLFTLCKHDRIEIGLHSSYQAGKEPEQIVKEKKKLESATGGKIKANRHHFLSSREPEHFAFLLKSEINHDFTMGYADVAGFRLGTCRAVRWINPGTRKLTSLVLHPLTIMECSLSEEKYMNLSYEEALDYSLGLINQTALHRGELSLLWHNTSLQTGYLKNLYSTLLDKIIQIDSENRQQYK